MTDNNTRPQYLPLLQAAEAYAKRKGIALSTLGARLVNDGKFFKTIQSGGGCTHDRYMFLMAIFSGDNKDSSQ